MTPADADALAATAHAGQVDKAGRPYVEHVRAVAALLTEHGDHAVMAGLLHDIVEDTDVTLDQLREWGYPEEVIRAVDAVTRRPDETYMDLIGRAAADPLGRLVKLADNAHNSRPDRLAVLDAGQAAWFREKYAKARTVLLAGNDHPLDAATADVNAPVPPPRRSWVAGDNEPHDLPPVRDAHGDEWWCSRNERRPGHHDGWRSAHLHFEEPSKTWWWLTMYRGPLREVSP